MPIRVAQIIVAGSALALIAGAQSSGNPLSGGSMGIGSERDGFRLYDISITLGYATSANPVGQFASPGDGALKPDENYGISGTVGYQHHREKNNVSITYTGSYSGLVHYSDANGYSESLSITAEHKLAPKWDTSFSASGQDGTLIQILNQPNPLSVISQMPADVNDLAAALGLGNFSSSSAASAILGAPVVQIPIRTLLLGDKVLSYSGSAALSYAYSKHLSFHLGGSGSGGENRNPGLNGGPATNFVLPHSYNANAGMSWTYSSTPRTDLGINLEGNRLQNRYQSAYTATATASAGRKLTERFFAKIYGGATYTDITEQTSGSPKTEQFVGGASLGMKTHDQTLTATYDRSVSDSFASFVGTYTVFSGTWQWARRGSRFRMSASAGQQQVRNTGFESFSGWQAGGGFSELLTRTTSVSGQYVYFKTAGSFQGNQSGFSENSVRMSFNWAPDGAYR